MQPISDNLKASLNRSNPVYKKTVELYRRVWSGSSYAYDTAVDITDYLIEDYGGTIMWKLDKEDYGVFNLDNVTLTFRNDRNQWKQDNPKGLFPSGKLINQSKIIIRIGGQLADGTYETLRSFTGYISGDPDYNPEEKTVSMTLVSAMSIFEKKNAEEISTLVTDELMGSDSGTVFTTANNGAGIIVIVKRGTTLGSATEIKPTTNYTASNLNQKTLPLTITLVTALTAGEKLYITYRYWYQDKALEWLAEQIMTLCGITSYAITPAVFSNSVEVTKDWTNEADFEAGTLQNIDTTSTVDSFRQKWHLIDDFSDLDYTTNLAWNVLSGSWSAATGNLVANTVSAPNAEITTSPAGLSAYGTWEFKTENTVVKFIHRQSAFGIPPPKYYYAIYSTTALLTLAFFDGTNIHILGVADSNVTMADTVTVTRSTAGEFKVYINGVLKISATEESLTSSTSVRVFSATGTFGSFWYSLAVDPGAHSAAAPVWTSAVLDGTASLNNWGSISATYTLNGGTVLIETHTSDSSDFSTDNDPAGWAEISETGGILSAKKRYLKARLTLNQDAYHIDVAPLIDEVVATYYTSTTTIDLVNLSGMSCRQVLDLITEMPAYEMGFKTDDTFIYRSRSTSVPTVLDLRFDTNIKEVSSLSDGIDRVYNRVTADYGIYRAVADASSDSEPNSVTRYGTREHNVSSSNLLPAENVNLATAVAPSILKYTKTPRRRCTISTKFIIWLELGDTVRVYQDEPAALRRWRWGDTDVKFGRADLEYSTQRGHHKAAV